MKQDTTIQVKISSELKRKLEKKALSKGITMSAYIRLLISEAV